MCGMALIVLTGLLIAAGSNRRRQSRRISAELFTIYADQRGLSRRERHILAEIAARASTRRIESIFTLPQAFNRGAARTLDRVVATHGASESRRLGVELAVLRGKLGFEKAGSDEAAPAMKSNKPDTRQIPVGKKLRIIHRDFNELNGVEATVTKNDQMELAVKLAAPLQVNSGATCCFHYYFGASVWEFDASVISCHEDVLVLNHSYDVRFINRRRFLRVPVSKPAFIARFPFERNLPHGDSDRTQEGFVGSLAATWGPPEFIPAKVTELAGPGLRVEAALEVEVGERVAVIFKIGQESTSGSQGASSHSHLDQKNRKALSRVVEDVGEVRHVRATENGYSIAVELTGLSDSNVSSLIRETNSASIEAAAKIHDVNVSSEDQRSQMSEREMQLTEQGT